MNRRDEFDAYTGPTIRQQWRAFWRLWRMSQSHTGNMASGEWQALFWFGPIQHWYYVAEYGDCRGLPDSSPWQYYQMLLRMARTPEDRERALAKIDKLRAMRTSNPA